MSNKSCGNLITAIFATAVAVIFALAWTSPHHGAWYVLSITVLCVMFPPVRNFLLSRWTADRATNEIERDVPPALQQSAPPGVNTWRNR